MQPEHCESCQLSGGRCVLHLQQPPPPPATLPVAAAAAAPPPPPPPAIVTGEDPVATAKRLIQPVGRMRLRLRQAHACQAEATITQRLGGENPSDVLSRAINKLDAIVDELYQAKKERACAKNMLSISNVLLLSQCAQELVPLSSGEALRQARAMRILGLSRLQNMYSSVELQEAIEANYRDRRDVISIPRVAGTIRGLPQNSALMYVKNRWHCNHADGPESESSSNSTDGSDHCTQDFLCDEGHCLQCRAFQHGIEGNLSVDEMKILDDLLVNCRDGAGDGVGAGGTKRKMKKKKQKKSGGKGEVTNEDGGSDADGDEEGHHTNAEKESSLFADCVDAEDELRSLVSNIDPSTITAALPAESIADILIPLMVERNGEKQSACNIKFVTQQLAPICLRLLQEDDAALAAAIDAQGHETCKGSTTWTATPEGKVTKMYLRADTLAGLQTLLSSGNVKLAQLVESDHFATAEDADKDQEKDATCRTYINLLWSLLGPALVRLAVESGCKVMIVTTDSTMLRAGPGACKKDDALPCDDLADGHRAVLWSRKEFADFHFNISSVAVGGRYIKSVAPFSDMVSVYTRACVRACVQACRRAVGCVCVYLCARVSLSLTLPLSCVCVRISFMSVPYMIYI